MEIARFLTKETGISSRYPKTKFPRQGDLFASVGQKAEIRNRQEIEHKGEGEEDKEKGYFSWREKGLPADRRETDVVHRQMEHIKVKGKPC